MKWNTRQTQNQILKILLIESTEHSIYQKILVKTMKKFVWIKEILLDRVAMHKFL